MLHSGSHRLYCRVLLFDLRGPDSLKSTGRNQVVGLLLTQTHLKSAIWIVCMTDNWWEQKKDVAEAKYPFPRISAPNVIETKVLRNYTACRCQSSSVWRSGHCCRDQIWEQQQLLTCRGSVWIVDVYSFSIGEELLGFFHPQTLLKSSVWIVFEPDPMNARFRYPKNVGPKDPNKGQKSCRCMHWTPKNG